MDLPKGPGFRLDGKRALVTGASSGLGLAAAVSIARAGADTTIAARRQPELQALADALNAEGCKVTPLVLDVADIAATQAVVADNGPFEVLVNSAGHARHGPAMGTLPDDYDAVMALNLRGAYFLTQAVAKGLIAAGRPGSLINISSQMGVIGGQERAVYCASKHGVEGFTKTFAIELGPHNIRINTICPTFIRTPLSAVTLDRPELRDWVMGKIKLDRLGELEDVMGPVVYLASDASALVTGISHLVDGGWTAG